MKRTAFIFSFVLYISAFYAQSGWVAPEEANSLKNPLQPDTETLKRGEKIYHSLCAACHGKTGKGDVPSMQTMNPKPANFTTEEFQSQSDGAIFWKLSEGRGLMASYKSMLTDEDRWAVVHYLRTFDRDDSSEPPVAGTKTDDGVEAFPFTTLVNAKTTHIMQSGGFGLTIQHRFGLTKFDEEMITNFLGLDLAANMRFAFEIPATRRLMFEVGRTRYGKFYDAGVKYLLLRQTGDGKTPFAMALYFNTAVTTEKAPVVSDNAVFENGDAFEYKFRHRLYYDTQVVFSRRFSPVFSAQIAGELIWRNLAPYSRHPREKNHILALPVSLRYKLNLRSALDFEIMPNTHSGTLPISFGYEVASSGNHVFQVTVTNTDRILSQNIFTHPTWNYDTDGFILGFNLTRYF